MSQNKITAIMPCVFELGSIRPRTSIHSLDRTFQYHHPTHFTQPHSHSYPTPKHPRNVPSSSTDFYVRKLHTTSSISNKALTEELRRLTENNSRSATNGSNLGPFTMPSGRTGERPMNSTDKLRWKEVSWNERIKRVFRNGRNLLVVGFGGSLGILVIYSITSELFAPSSPTNLMISTTETINRSQCLQEILRSPYTFHTSSHSSSSSKRLSNLNPHLPQSVEIRFMIEGSPANSERSMDLMDLGWWKMMIKKWISPLITSDVKQQSVSGKKTSGDEALEKDGGEERWWDDWIGSLLPKRSVENRPKKERVGWLERRLPGLGSYSRGEVTAEIVKEVGGGWKYKALVIDFPDCKTRSYRLDVLNELRKMEMKDRDEEEERSMTRYRFWTRRISV